MDIDILCGLWYQILRGYYRLHTPSAQGIALDFMLNYPTAC